LNLMVPVFALALVAAAAQSSAKPGCASIPYPDVSQECSRRQAEADTLCKRDAWECVGLDTKPLQFAGNVVRRANAAAAAGISAFHGIVGDDIRPSHDVRHRDVRRGRLRCAF